MGKIIAATALSGWAAIAWLAWHMADKRIGDCPSYDYSACVIRLTTQRDYVLVVALIVGLVILLAIMFAWAMLKARQGSKQPGSKSGWPSANRGQRAMLRSGVE